MRGVDGNVIEQKLHLAHRRRNTSRARMPAATTDTLLETQQATVRRRHWGTRWRISLPHRSEASAIAAYSPRLNASRSKCSSMAWRSKREACSQSCQRQQRCHRTLKTSLCTSRRNRRCDRPRYDRRHGRRSRCGPPYPGGEPPTDSRGEPFIGDFRPDGSSVSCLKRP